MWELIERWPFFFLFLIYNSKICQKPKREFSEAKEATLKICIYVCNSATTTFVDTLQIDIARILWFQCTLYWVARYKFGKAYTDHTLGIPHCLKASCRYLLLGTSEPRNLHIKMHSCKTCETRILIEEFICKKVKK